MLDHYASFTGDRALLKLLKSISNSIHEKMEIEQDNSGATILYIIG